MGEKGNVAAGTTDVVGHVAAGFEAVGSTAGEIGQTIAVGVVTAVATDEAKKRRAQGSDDKDDDGGPEATDKREM